MRLFNKSPYPRDSTAAAAAHCPRTNSTTPSNPKQKQPPCKTRLAFLYFYLQVSCPSHEIERGVIMAMVYHSNPVFMESFGGYYNNSNNTVMMTMEKRQVFLRSYQFCRKRSLSEKIRASLRRLKRVMWLRLRSARKIRKLVWSALRFRWGLNYRGRRRFVRLVK